MCRSRRIGIFGRALRPSGLKMRHLPDCGRGALRRRLRGMLFRLLPTALAISFAVALVPSPAHATDTYTVNSTADTPDVKPGDGQCATAAGVCTLRGAIQQANATPGGPDLITFTRAGEGQIQLTGQLPEITTDLSVRGTGASLVKLWGNAQQGVLRISNGAHVRISGVTISNGLTRNGGGVLSIVSDLTITDSVISGNVANGGGGIFAWGGTLRIERSTFRANGQIVDPNTNVQGGGGLTTYATNTDVIDSTFDGNLASYAGAINNVIGSLHVTGSTFTNNGSHGVGGAIVDAQGSTTLVNSTLVGNSARLQGGAIYAGGYVH